MREIESESRFVWKQLVFLISLPVLVLQIILGKKKIPEITRPLKELFHFIFQPKITVSLILVNIAVFLFEVFYFTQEQVLQLAFQPSDILALNFLPVVSSWFLHASIAHLIGNMIFLYIFGRIVEKDFGWKMLLIYFGAAIISDLASAFFGQGGIGASGAIAGLIGTAILMHPFYLTYLVVGIPLPIILIGWAAIIADITGILIPKNDNIGHFAHLGGYLAITLLVFFFSEEHKRKIKTGMLINIIFVAVFVYFWFFMR